MYKLLRFFFFLLDPERAHYVAMNWLRFLCSIGFRGLITRMFLPRSLPVTALGISFKNPVGLGAGFDKNAKYLRDLECLGFGFVEIGTVTPLPQPGNDKPRLFRLPKDKALINRMGFNNDGVDVIAERLRIWKNYKLKTTDYKLIIGGNIGKNKITPNEEAWKDYEKCFHGLHEYVDYFVVNVSSPNTPGLRELQEKDSLKKILTNLQQENLKYENQKPILLKIAPDLNKEQLDDVIELAIGINLDGLVVTNTTLDRSLLQASNPKLETIGAGGLSGLPLKKKSTEMIHYISQKTAGRIPIIGSGGIFTGADAREKISAGATLVQVWTGFIYEGPSIVKKICARLYSS